MCLGSKEKLFGFVGISQRCLEILNIQILECHYSHAKTGLSQYIDIDSYITVFLSAEGYDVKGEEAP